MPPTPESPARPIWWRDGEDDERAAEMLYTLFAGDVSAGTLSKGLDEWVLRETSIAAEAFPHVEFWRGLDIRWVQYSSAHAGVGEALRKLKSRFAIGDRALRHVSVDHGRQKRSRRGAGETEGGSGKLQHGRVLLSSLEEEVAELA